MSLFKKVMIIGLATIALGSAAMGATPSAAVAYKTASPGCTGMADASAFQNKDVAPPVQNAKDIQPVISAPAVQPADG